MRLESLQTGQPRTISRAGLDGHQGEARTSTVWKEPVVGRVWAGALGLSGDAPGDDPDRALLASAASHYPVWRKAWGVPDLGPGAFGENLTISGWDERTVCLGDLFLIGDLRVEVSGPGRPSADLEVRHRRGGICAEMEATGRPIDRVAQTIADRRDGAELAGCPAFSDRWRALLTVA